MKDYKDMNIFSAIFCIVMMLCASAAHGSTYYVSTAGNDANTGYESAPWRTIQKCANAMNGGDTCIVRDGSYSENVAISRSGLAGSLMAFKSESKRQAVLNGKINVTGNYIRLEGMMIVIPDKGQVGISVSGNYNEIVDCHVTTDSMSLGLNNTAISIGGIYNSASGNYVEKTCFGYNLTGANHLFQKNEANKLKLNGDCGDVDYMRFFGSNHVIKNNYFHGVNMNEIGKAHVDCFQTYDNVGPSYAISNVIVEGNYCSECHQGMMLSADKYYLSDGLIIRNNIFSNTKSWCASIHNIKNVKIYNNTCDATGGIHGMGCRFGASCEFKNNIFYGGSLYWFENASIIDGTADAPGKNNLLYKPDKIISGYWNDIVNKDPLFFNRTSGNYRLQASSPAIDAGAIIPDWSGATDRDGKPRPQGNGWDIGAYEYRATNIGSPANFRKVGD